jgi:phi LC3 family holin
MINWKIRFKNKTFLVALFSGLLLVAQHVAKLSGYELSDQFGKDVTLVFNSVLSLLVLIGIVQDPTVSGIGDSQRALDRNEPLKLKTFK